MAEPQISPEPGPTVLILGGFLPPPYGGIAKYMQAVIPRLLERGYRICNVQPPTESPSRLFTGAPGYRTAALHPRVSRGWASLLARDPRTTTEVARICGGIVSAGVRSYLAQVLATLCWYHEALRLAGGERIDIVHAYDAPWQQGLAASLLARRLKARLMVTTFGEVLPHAAELVPVDEDSLAYSGVVRRVLEDADCVASMTCHCARQVSRVGYSPERVRLVRLVLGMERFRPDLDGRAVRERYARDGESLLLFVGQVRPRKGVQTLVEALAARSAGPPARLLIVGPDHGYADELRARAAALGVADSITFVGPVSDADLPNYYAACDVCLFPTCTEIECLGLTFVQAMFAGRPVIATRIAGAPEVIRDGRDGYLVPPGDERAFAARIDEVLALPRADRDTVGAAARARVEELFDEQSVLGDLIRAYGELLSR